MDKNKLLEFLPKIGKFNQLEFDYDKIIDSDNKEIAFHNVGDIFRELKSLFKHSDLEYLTIHINYNNSLINTVNDRIETYACLEATTILGYVYYIQNDLVNICPGGSFTLYFQPPLPKENLNDINERIKGYLRRGLD